MDIHNHVLLFHSVLNQDQKILTVTDKLKTASLNAGHWLKILAETLHD